MFGAWCSSAFWLLSCWHIVSKSQDQNEIFDHLEYPSDFFVVQRDEVVSMFSGNVEKVDSICLVQISNNFSVSPFQVDAGNVVVVWIFAE